MQANKLTSRLFLARVSLSVNVHQPYPTPKQAKKDSDINRLHTQIVQMNRLRSFVPSCENQSS
jgi:hypothetical protein